MTNENEVALQFYRDENRAFWTKVAALLTINSLLLIGFTTLYIGCNPNSTLLLVIAASGISIQALWPIFALQSSAIWESMGRHIKVKGELESSYDQLAKPLECCMPQCLYKVFRKNPAGAIAIFLFFAIFMAIWVVAEVTVDTSTCPISHWVAILLPTIFVAFSVLFSVISAILVFRKHEEVTQIGNDGNEEEGVTQTSNEGN